MAIAGVHQKVNCEYKKSNFSQTTEQSEGFSAPEAAEQNHSNTKQISEMSIMDIYEKWNHCKRDAVKMQEDTQQSQPYPETETNENETASEGIQSMEESAQTEEKETKNKTEIIVKPDGSRVLVITMNIGGAETTMSLKISEPTEMQNEVHSSDMEQEEAAQSVSDMEQEEAAQSVSDMEQGNAQGAVE